MYWFYCNANNDNIWSPKYKCIWLSLYFLNLRFQTHCFRNFNSDFQIKPVKLTTPGVKALLGLTNITHQKLSQLLTIERKIDFLNTVASISVFLSELLCHGSCWFFCLYKNVFLENCAKERNFCEIFVQFSFANLQKKSLKRWSF